MKKELVFIQTVIPEYRLSFFKYLREVLGEKLEIYTGKTGFHDSLITTELLETKPLKNKYILNNRLLYQQEAIKPALKAKVAVMEINPRILSNWIILFLRKLRGKKTILWGHAWSRSGQHSKTDLLRHLMRCMASILIVYTKSQQQELKKKMPSYIVLAAPNALYKKTEVLESKNQKPITNIIFVSRLVPEKKPLLLVQSFSNILSRISEDCNLIIIGDGPERPEIEFFINQNSLNERVEIKGSISNIKKLQFYYNTAIFSVSTGYVGLSIIQSHFFGVPMLISKNEKHSPEIESALDRNNALYFETDDIKDLEQKILEIIESKEFWINSRKKIQKNAIKNYSIEAMAQPFINLIT